MHIKHDDAFSIFHAQQSLSELYAQLSLEANPPLYFTILHFWIKLFGIGPIAVKSLSVIFSIGSGIVIYLIGKRHMNVLGAFTAAFLFTFSNVHFDFSHEVRAFSLVFFLTSLSIYCFLLVIDKPKLKWLIALCLINAALPYSHYTAVLVPLTEFIILILMFFQNRTHFVRIAFTFLISAILFIPQLLKFRSTIPDNTFWLKTPTAQDLEYVFRELIGHGPSYSLIHKILLIGLALTIANLFYSLFKKDFDYRKMLLFIAIYFIPIYLNYWLAQYTPVFRLRYMLFAGIGPLLAMAYLISKLKISPVVLLFIAIYIMIPFKRSFTHKNNDIFRWDKVGEMLNENYLQGRKHFVTPVYRMIDFSYYYDRSVFSDYQNMFKLMSDRGFHGINNSNELNLNNIPDAVLIQCNPQDVDPERTIQGKLLLENYSLSESWFESKEINVELWKRDSLP